MEALRAAWLLACVHWLVFTGVRRPSGRAGSRVVAEELLSSVRKKPEGPLLLVIPWLPVEKTWRCVSQYIHSSPSTMSQFPQKKKVSTSIGNVSKEISQDMCSVLFPGGRIMSELSVRIPLRFLNFLPCLK